MCVYMYIYNVIFVILFKYISINYEKKKEEDNNN